MPLPTMNLAGADISFLPWDKDRPPGSKAQGMDVESQATSPRESASLSGLKDRRRASPEFEQGWDQARIAELSSIQISEMSRAELACVVRAARLPTVQIRPDYADRVTLERLAHRARLCCRNREDLVTTRAIDERRSRDA